MYLTRVEIQNIRAIKHLVWEINAENAAGWHVILGDNGAGKSTFVRGAVLACVGYGAAIKLEQYVLNWLNDAMPQLPNSSSVGVKFGQANCKMIFDVKYDKVVAERIFEGESTLVIAKLPREDAFVDIVSSSALADRLNDHILQINPCFAASFGPFRRFSGGDTEDNDLFENNEILRRHRTTFSERLALPDALKWLQQTQFKALEEDAGSRKLIENVKAFVNQPDFLPHNTKLEKVNSSGVHFVDGNGASVAAEELSDGYRSVLSLTFELLRLLSITHGPDIFETDEETGAITVAPPGVVLIDEVDAHLHPTWQKRIGFWLRKHFPQMQWIVTTHSPLICQAAEKGTIYKLPTPGTDETGRMLTGTERDRLVYGDILDAYSTEAFGAGITRSEASQKMLDRLSELNVKEIIDGLTPEETAMQERLRAMLPTTAAALPEEGLPV